MDPPNGRNHVWGLLLLATHQKAAPPLPASRISVWEALLCIIQCPARADPRPPSQPALEVRQQMWRGHPALAPRSRSVPTAEPDPASRSQGLAALATFAFGAPSDRVPQPVAPLCVGVRWNGVDYLLSSKRTSDRENRWNGSDPRKGTVCYSGSIYSNHPASPMLPPHSSTCPPAAQEANGLNATSP